MADKLGAEGIERIHLAAERHVGPDRIPGLVALVGCGDDVHVETLGSLSVGGAPVARDSLFRIASTTKPVTAATAIALADEGLISLDEPVDRLLPELADRRVLTRMDGPLDDTVPARRAITIRDLLTFTFGFGMILDMFTAPKPWPVVAATEELALSTIGPPEPGRPPEPDTWITPEGLAVGDEPDGAWSRPPAFPDGAAGLVSTVDDLHALARMLLGGGAGVLSPESVRLMTTDQLTPAQKSHGGLGAQFFSGRSWGFCQAVLDSGAFGWDGGLGSSWLVDPNHDLTVIVLTQRMWETSDPPPVHGDIQAAAYGALA
jgi:CubicO group peptidase (beta-lactamase class C family)